MNTAPPRGSTPTRLAVFTPPARKALRALAWLAAAICLLVARAVKADQTNLMSPVVSYQYNDNIGDEMDPLVPSPVVSYQYYEEAGDETDPLVLSPVASYQYFDWPAEADLEFQNSPEVSYEFQRGPATVVVASPKGGEQWAAGSIHLIWWVTVGDTSQINYYLMDYSLDGGVTWFSSVLYAPPRVGFAAWSVPRNAVSTQARVRVRAMNTAGAELAWGASANDFTITAAPPGPTAVPDVSNLAPISGERVDFTGQRSSDSVSGCAITSYSWDFGDGQTATGMNASHVYQPSSGSTTYTVSLTVTDCADRTDTKSVVVYVTGLALGRSQPQQAFSKDPVNLATGNYAYQHTDLRIPGRGLAFEFTRSYNSKDPMASVLPLGYGWNHSYNIHLWVNDSNSVVVAFGDGHEETYATDGAGGYVAEPGVFNTLVSSGDGFTLTTKDQRQYDFDSNGQLTSIADRNGNTLSLSYADGELAAITDTVGRSFTFASDTNGCLSRITDPLGRTIQFAYDANTNLVSVTDARGGVTQFSYDGNHQMTRAIDPRGNAFVSMVYDAERRVVSSQQDALGNATAFAYDFVNRVTTVTDPFGNQSFDYYDQELRLTKTVDALGQVQSFEYDGNNCRTKVVDRDGAVTMYGYDSNGNVSSKLDALGSSTTVRYNSRNDPTNRTDALGGATTFAYDLRGNLTNSVNALGGTNSAIYNAFGQAVVVTDANGNSRTNTYDSFGNLAMVQDSLGGSNTFTYDIAGRELSRVDALGRTNLFFYDDADNLTASVDASGHTNSFTYDGNNNRLTATDFLGNTTTNVFDQKDRLAAVLDPEGGAVTNEYDALDRKTAVRGAMGGVTRFGYDAVGNLVAVTNPVGSVTRYTYDPNGNRTSIIDPLGDVTTNVFDALNRLVLTQDALGHETRAVYDVLGRKVQTIDALNRTNQFGHDALGRLVSFTDAAGGTVFYTYDAAGNRTSITDPNGHTTTNLFDSLNRLVTVTEPAGGVSHFAYNLAGNLVSKTDPNGHTITYTYDAENRLANIAYPTDPPVTFNYDANGNRTGMTDAIGNSAYSYDTLNRLTSVADCYGQTVSYTYDLNGNRTSLTYPGGKTVTYRYDAANRLRSVTDWLGNTTTYQYDADGSLTSAVNPNGTVAAYQYDAANRLASLTNMVGDSRIISGYRYTLDAVGNQVQSDQLEQLPTIPVAGQFTNQYDADNRMVVSAGQSQDFDANGNLLSFNGTNVLFYDYENRLLQSAIQGGTNVYEYDGGGNRVSATRDGVVTHYVLDRNTPLVQVLAETDSGGTPRAYYIYGLGLISKIDASGAVHYYHFDSRGSTVALTDSSGQITDAYAYDPFGQSRASAGPTDNPFRYLGRHGVVDEEDGLLYVRARYYFPNHGRFVTKDPTTGKDGDSQSLNRYIYALNNPVALVDISGFSAQEASGIPPALATSDTSLFHNTLISPLTLGFATQVAGSTPSLAGTAPQQGSGSFDLGDWTASLADAISSAASVPRIMKLLKFTESQQQLLQNVSDAAELVGFATEAVQESGGLGNVIAGVANAPSNIQWLIHNATPNERLEVGETAVNNAAAAGLNTVLSPLFSAVDVVSLGRVHIHISGSAYGSAVHNVQAGYLNLISSVGNVLGTQLYNAAPSLFQ